MLQHPIVLCLSVPQPELMWQQEAARPQFFRFLEVIKPNYGGHCTRDHAFALGDLQGWSTPKTRDKPLAQDQTSALRGPDNRPRHPSPSQDEPRHFDLMFMGQLRKQKQALESPGPDNCTACGIDYPNNGESNGKEYGNVCRDRGGSQQWGILEVADLDFQLSPSIVDMHDF